MSAHGRSRSGRPGRGNASARGGDEGPSVLFFYIYVLMKIAYNSLGFVIDVAYDTSAVVCSFLTFDAPNLFLWLIVSVFAVTNFQ